MRHNLITYAIFCCFFTCEYGIDWQDINTQKPIWLYAGAINQQDEHYDGYVGIDLYYNDAHNIKHDLRKPIPLADNCAERFQSEDVFEHIEYEHIPAILNEIYRILKPNGFLRLSVPDYHCDVLRNRSIYDNLGKIQFDPGGGGRLVNGKVIDGGHVWFPTIDILSDAIKKSLFYQKGTIIYHHYWINTTSFVLKPIDHSLGFVKRTPEHDPRVQNPPRPMSIVVDLIKKN